MSPHEESPEALKLRAPQNAQLGGIEQLHDTVRTALLQAGRRDGLWRRNASGGTSEPAAKVRDRRPLRELVLVEIEAQPSTPEMVFARLKAAGVQTVLTSVRPRCTELAKLGLVADSGDRGRGEGGCKAIIWRATSASERADFLAAKEVAE